MTRTLLGISLSSLLLIATCAYADDSTPSQAPAQATSQAAGNSDQGGTIYGSSASGGGGLTRSDVKQQLVTAEQDGELKQLDRTVYHGQ